MTNKKRWWIVKDEKALYLHDKGGRMKVQGTKSQKNYPAIKSIARYRSTENERNIYEVPVKVSNLDIKKPKRVVRKICEYPLGFFK